jgi:hypothetical protein
MAEMIRGIEESNDFIGNRTSDLPNCTIMPQPIKLPLTLDGSERVVSFSSSLHFPCTYWTGTWAWARSEHRSQHTDEYNISCPSSLSKK